MIHEMILNRAKGLREGGFRRVSFERVPSGRVPWNFLEAAPL